MPQSLDSPAFPQVGRRAAWSRLVRGALLLGLLYCAPAPAGEDPPGGGGAIHERQVASRFAPFYEALQEELGKARFRVIFKADIGRALERNSERWKEQYNRNAFEEVRALVLCNPWYANQVLNLTPRLMAFCPINVTVLHKQGNSTVLYERLAPLAEDSAAADVFWEVDQAIIAAIEEAATRVTGDAAR